MESELETLVAFLQTRITPGVADTPVGLRAWLAEQGLLVAGEAVDEDDVRHMRRVRAALFGLIRDGRGAAADPRTQGMLDAVFAAAPLRVQVDRDGVLRLVSIGTGVARAMTELVLIAYRAELRGDMARLKVCRGCDFAFFDATKNRSRVWCEMAVCGSQEKSRAYRKRQAGKVQGSGAMPA